MSSLSKSQKNKMTALHHVAVRNAVAATLEKLRADIEESHARGASPMDYSLGFTNALIMADHHLALRQGEPQFYDHRGMTGKLPKPVKFTHETAEEELARAEYDAQVAQVLLQAMLVCEAFNDNVVIEKVRAEVDRLQELIMALDQDTEPCPVHTPGSPVINPELSKLSDSYLPSEEQAEGVEDDRGNADDDSSVVQPGEQHDQDANVPVGDNELPSN